MSFNTTEALQRHLQRHFDRTPPPTPPKPVPAAAKATSKPIRKIFAQQPTFSDDVTCSSLSQSADEDYLVEFEDELADSEGSDDSYVPGSQGNRQKVCEREIPLLLTPTKWLRGMRETA